jgi:phage terminase small subunit
MTGPQTKFVKGVAKGLTYGKAYAAAYPKAKASSAAANAGRLMKNDEILSQIDALRERAAAKLVLSVADRLQMLTRMAEANETESPIDATRAVAELNKMTGGYEPERHELEIIVTIGGSRTAG